MAVLKVKKNGEWIVVGTGEKGEKGDTGNIKDLDTALSDTSTNAVQNKVITEALSLKADASTSLKNVYDSGDVSFSSNVVTETLESSHPFYSLGYRTKTSISAKTLTDSGVWIGRSNSSVPYTGKIKTFEAWLSSSSSSSYGLRYFTQLPFVSGFATDTADKLCFSICSAYYSANGTVQMITMVSHSDMDNIEFYYTGTQTGFKYLQCRLRIYE